MGIFFPSPCMCRHLKTKKKIPDTWLGQMIELCVCGPSEQIAFSLCCIFQICFLRDYIWKWQTLWLILAGVCRLPLHFFTTAANMHPALTACCSCAFGKYECAPCKRACVRAAPPLHLWLFALLEDVEGKQWDNKRNPPSPSLQHCFFPQRKEAMRRRRRSNIFSAGMQIPVRYS